MGRSTSRNTNPEMKQLLGLVTKMAERLDKLETPKQSIVMTAEPPPTVVSVAAPAPVEKPKKIEAFNPKSRKIPLPDRIKHVLASKVLDTKALAAAVDEKPEALEVVINELRASGKIVNIGMADIPRWFWRVGPEVGHRDLVPIFARLLKYQPMSVYDLRYATGVGRKAADEAMIEVRRSGLQVKDLSAGGKNRLYFIEPDHMRDARLKPRWKNSKAHSSLSVATDEDFEDEDGDDS